ncbi:hypothetical protein, partial [Limnobacter sp.]|uniref:hypothetical protein n=1 Tax=Limnobacter sp. TaxID=2003368 RepID=UPI002FDF49D2
MSKRFSINSTMTFIAMISMFLLSDIYYPGTGRVFDYLGLLISITITASLINTKTDFNSHFKKLLPIIIIFPWIIAGTIFNGAILASFAMITGAAIIYPLFNLLHEIPSIRKMIERQINYLIITSSLILIFQTTYYFTTQIYIDFPQLFGSIESRGLNEQLGYVRFSGLFQEPNAFCTTMFCLLSLCKFSTTRKQWIEILGILSIFTTQSLWGFGAGLLLIWILFGIRKFLY